MFWVIKNPKVMFKGIYKRTNDIWDDMQNIKKNNKLAKTITIKISLEPFLGLSTNFSQNTIIKVDPS